jgi:hypothetical protein
MTIGTANVSIQLDAHAPKKDASIAVGVQAPGLTGLVIWCRADVNIAKVQTIVGTIEVLKCYVLNNLSILAKAATIEAHVVAGGGIAQVVSGGIPTTDDITLIVGQTVNDNEQSHFIDRTVKRLVEAWLEGPIVVT